MKRDIGAIGENCFLNWCEPEGFRAQKSQVDRLGWDFLLEREPERLPNRPLDEQNDLPKFLIQVKSTEKAGDPPRIKLSALKHLVDADLPAAIVALFFSADGRAPSRSLLVPIDDTVISGTLRRVRREEARGNRSINKTTVPVPLERAIDIGPTGEGLSDALAGMIGNNASEYVTAKIRHRQTCGFERDAAVGRFFVPGDDAAKKIGELFLGGPRELQVLDLTIERRRFGIALENDREHFQQAVLEMNVPPLLATTIELASDAGEWLSMEVDVFIVPPVEGTPGRVRFANSYFEVLLDFEKTEAGMTFNYAGDRTVDLEEAVSIVEVGVILSRPIKTVTIHFKGTKLELPAGSEEGPFHRWVHAAPALRRIVSTIARSGRRLPRQILVSDFYHWVEKHIEFLALTSTPGVNMIFPKSENSDVFAGQKIILTPFSLEFGGTQYTALIEIPIETVKATESEITLVGGQPQVVAEIARSPGSDTADFVETAIEKSKRDRQSTEPALVAGGFENWRNVILTTA
ncbi:hypothetical protein [Mesorhizobium sp. CA4]|uniref:hypothetical protein n=1 Tax=Mesorhizobium sp. CA4 TaxID=588499 RepID=UPI001CD13B3C|nr:hypothetical protein [Mesorhizobium sp. CA4]MBZ9823205.1 hypothetical protein [Mesorhizobium sp. CA4]